MNKIIAIHIAFSLIVSFILLVVSGGSVYSLYPFATVYHSIMAIILFTRMAHESSNKVFRRQRKYALYFA